MQAPSPRGQAARSHVRAVSANYWTNPLRSVEPSPRTATRRLSRRSVHSRLLGKTVSLPAEQLDLPVSRLSGGEQARLLIARLMLQRPTSPDPRRADDDLIFRTLDVVGRQSAGLPRCVMLVTHDRWLLDRVSTILLALDGTGKTEWFADLCAMGSQRKNARRQNRLVPLRHDPPSHPVPNRDHSDGKTNRPVYREQKEWAKMEDRILQAEETIAACQAAVEDPNRCLQCRGRFTERSEALDAARKAAERLYNRWTELEGETNRVCRPT